MSEVYLCSDLHLGHKKLVTWRGFETLEAHDDFIIEKLQALHKKDTLWILGDVAFSREGLARLEEVPCYKKLVLGNHDKFSMTEYSKYFTKIFGAVKYKDFILTHIPVHSEQQYRYRGNIHGHLHSKDYEDPWYFNVNIDTCKEYPVPFEIIEEEIGQ